MQIPLEYHRNTVKYCRNTIKYNPMPSAETKTLDFDIYAMPGALVWGDLHYFMRLRDWEGSGPKFKAREPKFEGSGTKISFHIWPLDPGPSRAQAWAFMGPPPSGDDNADGGGGGYGPKHWRPLKKGPGPGTSMVPRSRAINSVYV